MNTTPGAMHPVSWLIPMFLPIHNPSHTGAAAPAKTAWLLRLCALCWLLLSHVQAHAVSYTYRSDSFTWESAANVITWDKTCTGYPGDDDKAIVTFTGGFTFTFAGIKYSSVRVLSNGGVQFGADNGFFRTYVNTNLPAASPGSMSGCTASATTNILMAYWTDLDPSRAGSGNVTWEQKGTAPNRYLVVSWNSVYQYNTTTPYAFQIILYENGEFKYQYGNANASGSNATIGVQVGSGDYTLYLYNSGYNANGSAIRWFVPNGAATRVAEYRFDEYGWNGALGEVTDATGHGYGGVRLGSASPVAGGVVCRALDVPANTNSTSAGVDTLLNVASTLGASGSISFWHRSNSTWTSAADGQLFDATLLSNLSFHLVRRSNGSLRFAISDSAGSTLVADTPNQSFGSLTWVHITATWRLAAGNNQSVLRLYVNGVQAGIKTGTTTGVITPTLGTLVIGDSRANLTSNNATINSANGQLDELRISNYELSPAEIALDLVQTHECAPPLHHIEIRHSSGNGLTCMPSTLTVAACQDASCSSPYTGGITGTLSSSNATTLWPNTAAFTIAPGSSSTTVPVQLRIAGSTLLGVSASQPSAPMAASCNFGSPSCSYIAQDSGLLANIGNHVAESIQTLTLQAVRKSDNSAACVAAFANQTRAIKFSCSYANPLIGYRPVRVGDRALNAGNLIGAACDATGQTLSLAFNASGIASTTLQYADAGQINLGLTYSGSSATNDPALTLTGSSSFISAPAWLGFFGITTGPIRAGTAFSASLTAYNSAGSMISNFGRETPPSSISISHSRAQPTGSGASNGVFSGSLGSFSNGVAVASNLVWSEVGQIDLTATLGNYLGSGLNITGGTGNSGAVGRFIPHHFDLVATPACGTFSYSGQPFRVVMTAKNGLPTPGTTVNYDSSGNTLPSFAKMSMLTDTALGNLGNLGASANVAASTFRAGVASVTTPAYSYFNKLTAPRSLTLRVTDSDGASSAGTSEPTMPLRSGRLRVFNAFGSEKSALALPVQTQYWSGSAWVLNSADSCSAVPAGAIVPAQYLDNKGAARSTWAAGGIGALTVTGGLGQISVAAPPVGVTGSIDLALNLGSSAVDASCLSSHPASSGAGLPWLRSRNGNCASGWGSDPSARVSFGIATPETRKSVHVREIY
jgi:MSHA biogenesis protein MshQ